MKKKILISLIIFIAICILVGAKICKVDNVDKKEARIDTNVIGNSINEAEGEIEQNNIIELTEELIAEEQNNSIEESKNNNDVTDENKKTEKQETSKIAKTEVTTSSTVKQESIVNSNETKSQEPAKENKTETTTTQNQNEQVKQETPKKEETKVTEEYIYNSTKTAELINDINTFAKENPDLWGTNGEKMYSIEVRNLTGINYISPYRKELVRSYVKSVYSVKFLVYVVDHVKTGYTTETKYYIDVTNF